MLPPPLDPSRSTFVRDAAAFIGATMHVLGESALRAMRYDTRLHLIVP